VFGPVLSVDVGGVVFRTTASTLRRAPFFAAVLDRDEGSAMFVDRSGDLFGYILEYLRCGHWLLKDRDKDQDFVNALRDEATFYGLDTMTDYAPVSKISEFVTVWQFQNDTSLYVDCFEQTIREDPNHQGLFRLCKYTGGLPLDQQTCTKRFKATSHSLQSVIAYFALRGCTLQQVIQNSMLTHTTSADGQTRSGFGTQYILSRFVEHPSSWSSSASPPASRRATNV